MQNSAGDASPGDKNRASSVVRQRASSLVRQAGRAWSVVRQHASSFVRLFASSTGRRKLFTWALLSLAGVAVVAVLFLTLTRTGRYLTRAAWEESKILWRRRPIAQLVNDTTVPRATRAKLRLVLDAREFARRSLQLDVGQSFTTFSPLERDTLVLVLSAAYRDRLEHYRWWFPVVGRVPYKGYFDVAEATAEERDFQRRGFDTYLRPASAFSTLGWFNDPLVSTTLKSDTLSLANTVIHELTHNTYYASGQAEFNESFANFAGARGSADFFRWRRQPRAVAEAEARWSDEKILARFWKRLHDDIDSVFKAHPGTDAMRARLALRDSVYRAARQQLVFRLGPQLRTVAPRYLERVRLDNAALLARRIYLTDLDLFDSVHVRERRDTRLTIQRIIELAKTDPQHPYEALRSWVAGSGGAGAAGTKASAQ
jgi:predicted aminopeptidase